MYPRNKDSIQPHLDGLLAFEINVFQTIFPRVNMVEDDDKIRYKMFQTILSV